MIISRTPLRVSFCGGGTDLPAYYRREAGAVFSTAINKYIYITVNKKFDRKIRASYSITEIVDSVDQLQHELIRESLKLLGIDGTIEITSHSDIPSQGTGLGSSSTYTVGLLNALHAYLGHHAGAARLAEEACRVEIDRCGKPVGRQDQWIAAHGGLQYLRFQPDDNVFIDPVICRRETKLALEERLLLLFTGAVRSADAILTEQSANTERQADKRAALREMARLAHALYTAVSRDDLADFGAMLHEGWSLKKRLARGISTTSIDEWYDRARKHGALGGKILGAGGGGFLLLYADPERHSEIAAALPELQRTDFRFEPQGSKIIYVEE